MDTNKSESDDDTPALSSEALAALEDFYVEKLTHKTIPETAPETEDIDFEEDWQLSQFWYSDVTAEILSREALRAAGSTGKIACVSCPTLYRKLRLSKPPGCQVKLFEFDRRFQVFQDDYVPYDYNEPLKIPKEHEGIYDFVITDPPYLSEECLTGICSTIRFLSKGCIVVCTGAVMEELVTKLLGLKLCDFVPTHTCSLGNTFGCYANYDLDEHLQF